VHRAYVLSYVLLITILEVSERFSVQKAHRYEEYIAVRVRMAELRVIANCPVFETRISDRLFSKRRFLMVCF